MTSSSFYRIRSGILLAQLLRKPNGSDPELVPFASFLLCRVRRGQGRPMVNSDRIFTTVYGFQVELR